MTGMIRSDRRDPRIPHIDHIRSLTDRRNMRIPLARLPFIIMDTDMSAIIRDDMAPTASVSPVSNGMAVIISCMDPRHRHGRTMDERSPSS